MAWIHIEPIPQVLTLNERRVKALLDQGKTIFQIAYKLYMGVEYVREIIYSIRKKEAINHMARLTQEERAEIYRLYREGGMSQRDLAARYYVSHNTIGNIIKKLERVQGMCDALTAADKPMPNTGINEDFEQAVDAMIEEREAADVEQKSAIAEPEKLPPVVRRAIDDQISEYEFQISERDSRIEELKDEIAEFRKDIAALKAWKEAHDD